jgi:hypothetical protein
MGVRVEVMGEPLSRKKTPDGSSARYFDEIVKLVTSGMSVREACASRSEFPCSKALQAWARSRDRSNELKRATRPKNWREVEIIKSFDAFLAQVESGKSRLEAARIATGLKNPGQPIHSVLKKRPDLAERYRYASRRREAGPNAIGAGAGARYTDAQIARAVQGVAKIEAAGNYSVRVEPGGITLKSLSRRARTLSLDAALRSQLRLLASSAALERAAREDGASLRQVCMSNELFRAADAALPRGLDPADADDVRSDLIVAALEGKTIDRRVALKISARESARRRYAISSDVGAYGAESKVTPVDLLAAQNWAAA